MKIKEQKHIFSIFYSEIDTFINKDTITLTNKDIINRLINILRLKAKEEVILFNDVYHAHLIIYAITSQQLECRIISMQKNQILKPTITIILPYLKREACESAIYKAAALGVQAIYFFLAEKSQMSAKAFSKDRLEKIIIAACEQSRNYVSTHLHLMKNLEDILSQKIGIETKKIVCDQYASTPLNEQLKKEYINQEYVIAVGPEGDFMQREKSLFKEYNFSSVLLAPTVLRSEDAIFLATGIIRNFYC